MAERKLLADGIAHSLAALRRAQTFLRALGIDIISVAKAERAGGSSGCVQLSKISSVPSAPSAALGTIDRGHHTRCAGCLRRQGSTRFDGNVLVWGTCPSLPTTMLTVLTQTPASVLGNGNEDYGHPGCPFDMRSEGLLRRVSLQTGASSHELMGDSSRNSAVVAGTFARAYERTAKPQSRRHRGGSGGRLRPETHGGRRQLGANCLVPSACSCR
jgi:hypothetical protein